MVKAKGSPATETQQEAKYTKAALVASKRFQGRRDLLNVLLDEGKQYTISDVENRINNYLTKEV